MKKYMFFVTALALTLLLSNTQSYAQSSGGSYRTALGLGIDFGDGSTGVGISAKHFFNLHNAGEANLLFYSGSVTGLNVLYEYHGQFHNAAGLQWYAGLGPQLFFGNDDAEFAIRPLVGLDYKIPNVPLGFAFDWRPIFWVSNGTTFTAARFGLAFRYCF